MGSGLRHSENCWKLNGTMVRSWHLSQCCCCCLNGERGRLGLDPRVQSLSTFRASSFGLSGRVGGSGIPNSRPHRLYWQKSFRSICLGLDVRRAFYTYTYIYIYVSSVRLYGVLEGGGMETQNFGRLRRHPEAFTDMPVFSGRWG